MTVQKFSHLGDQDFCTYAPDTYLWQDDILHHAEIQEPLHHTS
jgi:hypothetical protein